MQVKSEVKNSKFKPVSLTFVLETEEEFEMMYQMLNHGYFMAEQTKDLVWTNYAEVIDPDKLYAILKAGWQELQQYR